MRFAELDAVTVDGFGTLVELVDPVPPLGRALRAQGVKREPAAIHAAFEAEASYYRPQAVRGRDTESLAELRLECAAVFLEAVGAELDPMSFVDAFVDSISFEPAPGAVEALAALQARGLDLAVVSNWDIGLHEHLARLGLEGLFSTVVTSAEAGAPKPEPAIFALALERLGVKPGRAAHVGDEPADEDGARAAGMGFVPAPLATAFEGWA